MLLTGVKGGNILNNMLLNQIIDSAEQLSNINVCSHIRGLSNNNGNDGTNTIYHKQERDRLTFIAAYFSRVSLTTDTYPLLLSATGINGTDYTSSFTAPVSSTETFNFQRDGTSYILTIKKITYTVAAVALKRLRFTFSPMTPKSWINEQISSLYVIQHDSSITEIDRTIEGGVSDVISLNKVKEAFRKKQSYNLRSNGVSEIADDYSFSAKINTLEDMHEFGHSDLDFYFSSGESGFVDGPNLGINSSKTTGTIFNYSTTNKDDDNILRIKRNIRNGSIYGRSGYRGINDNTPYYLYVDNTKNLAINSIANDALNGYELTMLHDDYVNRLQGRLDYPVLGRYTISNENINSFPFAMIIKKRTRNIDYDQFFTLTSGYKVKFAIT